MSRIGKKTIQIPSGVTATFSNDVLTITGPKGALKRVVNKAVSLDLSGNEIKVDVVNKEDKKERSLWGTFSAHAQNMVDGVTKGFKKQLEVNGVGYRVAMQGKDLKLDLGMSHTNIFVIPAGLTATVEKNMITLEGSDIELLGQTAAEIRSLRKPEPYKGKGIKYATETIRRKAGKTAK
jgi:large subunit ribosomal protein L6